MPAFSKPIGARSPCGGAITIDWVSPTRSPSCVGSAEGRTSSSTAKSKLIPPRSRCATLSVRFCVRPEHRPLPPRYWRWYVWKGDWSQHEKPCRLSGTRQPTAREGQVGPAGWRRGRQYQGSRVMPVKERDLSSRAGHDVGRDMRTGESLTASDGVQSLQRAHIADVHASHRCSHLFLP